MTRTRSPHYSVVTMTLHWLTAVAIVLLLVAGLWMTDAIKHPETRNFAYKVYQWHKGLGLTVLVLTALRIGWRLANPPPPLPATMTAFERAGASFTHAAFYVLLLAIPLAGWAMVSASPLGLPTIVFGLFEWPHIPVLAGLEDKKFAEDAFKAAHKYMGFGLMALLGLHVAAAMKHHLVNRDDVLARMLPGVRVRKPRSDVG
jgi:cytochrome b561